MLAVRHVRQQERTHSLRAHQAGKHTDKKQNDGENAKQSRGGGKQQRFSLLNATIVCATLCSFSKCILRSRFCEDDNMVRLKDGIDPKKIKRNKNKGKKTKQSPRTSCSHLSDFALYKNNAMRHLLTAWVLRHNPNDIPHPRLPHQSLTHPTTFSLFFIQRLLTCEIAAVPSCAP